MIEQTMIQQHTTQCNKYNIQQQHQQHQRTHTHRHTHTDTHTQTHTQYICIYIYIYTYIYTHCIPMYICYLGLKQATVGDV